ncbi:MAG: hypothetical protein JXA46_17520 [Dehalococcoidales bacterium]|nr:hypothetical protein [Dehalococcoidales bacterium]
MTDKKILVVNGDFLKKIDDNRGELSRTEFLELLIDNLLQDKSGEEVSSLQYVSREEFQEFTQGMKDLLRRFLDFFISYGMELGEEPKDRTFNELVQKLQTLSASGGKPRTAGK